VAGKGAGVGGDTAKRILERTGEKGGTQNELLANFFQTLLKKPASGSGRTSPSSSKESVSDQQ
jgi:hypothetical protein